MSRVRRESWRHFGADSLLAPQRIEALVIEDEEEYGAQDGDLGGMDGDDGADYGFDLPFDSEASPEPALHPLRSPSLELRAPFVQDDDATPATSASPATDTKAKPSLKRKAVKSSAPPAKRRKRPAVKAVKSRVLRPTRKPLDEERPGKPRALTLRGRAVGSRSSRN